MLVCSEPPNVAVTEFDALNVTAQVVEPEHAPDQPAKVLVDTGVAVKVIGMPGAKAAAHAVEVAEQLIPGGLLITVPAPAPAMATVNPIPALNAAVTVAAAVMVRTQAFVPEQPPLQPPKK
jgi:hypothetical protein